jgi:hypothetical protein
VPESDTLGTAHPLPEVDVIIFAIFNGTNSAAKRAGQRRRASFGAFKAFRALSSRQPFNTASKYERGAAANENIGLAKQPDH